MTVFPCGIRPDASNLNFVAGQTVPNAVIAPVSSAGTVCFYVYGSAHLLADLSGYFPTGSDLTTLTPARVLDTRGGVKVGNAAGSGAPFELSILSKGGLPVQRCRRCGAQRHRCRGREPEVGRWVRIRLSVRCFDRRVERELRRWSNRAEPRDRSSVGQRESLLLRLRHGSSAGRRFGVVPLRKLVRPVDAGSPDQHSRGIEGGQRFRDRLGPRGVGRRIRRTTRSGLRAGPRDTVQGAIVGQASGGPVIGAVSLNVTVTEDLENPTTGGGYVTVFPCGTRPDASNLNFVAGQTVANAVIAPVSPAGTICFYVYGTAHLLADVSGFYHDARHHPGEGRRPHGRGPTENRCLRVSEDANAVLQRNSGPATTRRIFEDRARPDHRLQPGRICGRDRLAMPVHPPNRGRRVPLLPGNHRCRSGVP